jgi:hypothetical protein
MVTVRGTDGKAFGGASHHREHGVKPCSRPASFPRRSTGVVYAEVDRRRFRGGRPASFTRRSTGVVSRGGRPASFTRREEAVR